MYIKYRLTEGFEEFIYFFLVFILLLFKSNDNLPNILFLKQIQSFIEGLSEFSIAIFIFTMIFMGIITFIEYLYIKNRHCKKCKTLNTDFGIDMSIMKEKYSSSDTKVGEVRSNTTGESYGVYKSDYSVTEEFTNAAMFKCHKCNRNYLFEKKDKRLSKITGNFKIRSIDINEGKNILGYSIYNNKESLDRLLNTDRISKDFYDELKIRL